MATTETIAYRAEILRSPKIAINRAATVMLALTVVAVLVHGYHPYAEDGGLYLSEIKKVLNPALYPSWSHFVTVPGGLSLFAPVVAFLVRGSHLSVMAIMLLIYIVSIWATLIAAWMIAAQCFRSTEACYGASALLALCLTTPIAGTSLMLMDPYVTARSVSTPCGMMALAAAITVCRRMRDGTAVRRRSIVLLVGSAALAEIVHPLMATYALGCIVLLVPMFLTRGRSRIVAISGLCGLALAVAACVYWFTPPPSLQYLRVAQTRTYWFIDRWHWYEQFGLAAPLALLAIGPRLKIGPGVKIGSGAKPRIREGITQLVAQMAIVAGLTGMVIALFFAREASASYAVARLQPLRIFQMIYILMIVLGGGALAERVLKQHLWRWAALVAFGGCGMLYCQLQTYPNSTHLEVPWSTPQNQWEQGFMWIRQNTPGNALFAIDSNYITANGEDAQNFRAIAERSTLPDYSKDGGVAAIAPELASRWTDGEAIGAHLDRASDGQRAPKLSSAGVSWVVLSSAASTGFTCPYMNWEVKVCRTPNN